MKKEQVVTTVTAKKWRFIEDYMGVSNAATGSKYDANANVTTRNIATLSTELGKEGMLKLNYSILYKYVEKKFGEKLANQLLEDEDSHIIYLHDSTSIMPYCVAISLYPFLLNGLRELGGTSGAPKHADSFIGGLINLIFLIAGQFAGAVAVPETIPYLDHFLRIDYGEDYIQHLDEVIDAFGNRQTTLRTKIEDLFQQFVYSINQPAGARGYQSPFTNIAYFDKGYFNSIFKDFIFPDGDEPNYESTKELQKIFIKWFNKERTKEIITFPVETMNLLYDKNTKEFVDKDMADFTAEAWAQGHSFFLYNSDSADALSSCCRLKNAMEDNVFSYTLGAGGIETGSKKVITLNLNRIVQDWYNAGQQIPLKEYILSIEERVHQYLEAWNDYLWDMYNADLLTVYKAGFIDLDKQYVTSGVNGFVEAAEFLSKNPSIDYEGIEVKSNNIKYQQFARDILNTIKELNASHKTKHLKFNTEFVPGENLGVKNYKWDKKDGYWVPENRNCYNSYFYPVEDETYSVLEKINLHGNKFIGCLDGGSALHCNLDSHLSKEQYRKLMNYAAQVGCSYMTFNIPNTICNECGHIDKRKLDECPVCGSKNIDYATRIIGYLKRVSNFSEARQVEASKRYYGKIDE